MGVSQTKRVQVVDNTVIANGQLDVVITTSEDPCNIHGMIVDLWIADGVSQIDFGQWAVSLLPRAATAVPILTTGAVNTEVDTAVFWMISSWMVSGQNPVRIGGAPKTSRNCPRNGRLVVSVANSPVSGGTVRVHGTVSWFETIK